MGTVVPALSHGGKAIKQQKKLQESPLSQFPPFNESACQTPQTAEFDPSPTLTLGKELQEKTDKLDHRFPV